MLFSLTFVRCFRTSGRPHRSTCLVVRLELTSVGSFLLHGSSCCSEGLCCYFYIRAFICLCSLVAFGIWGLTADIPVVICADYLSTYIHTNSSGGLGEVMTLRKCRLRRFFETNFLCKEILLAVLWGPKHDLGIPLGKNTPSHKSDLS